MLSDYISAAIRELEEGLSYLAQTPGYHMEPGDEARMLGILSDLFELLYALDNPNGTPDTYALALQRAKQNWLALIYPVESNGHTKSSISDILKKRIE
jgi:hypothetical protein